MNKHIKKISFIVIGLALSLIVFISIAFGQKSNDKNNDSKSAEDISFANVDIDLGSGYNIGNTLDSCDWTYFGSKNTLGFQAALVYSTYPWSTWDASDYISFDNDGNAMITWDLNSLKSNLDLNAKSFYIQIVNHDSSYEGTNVTCDVKDITIKGDDSKLKNIVNAKNTMRKLTIENSVSEFICVDMTSSGLKTSDLKDKVLSVKLKLSDYYVNISENNAKLEESWGNPQISENMIKALKKEGFDTIRVPVTYFNHISSDGTIEAEFLDRVEQVVDWVIENDMYCIIDVHHDTGNQGWIKSSAVNYEKNKDTVYSIFVQIANKFKNKNDKLILEGLNEAVNEKTKWYNIPLADMKVMNQWNQLFVDAVRSTGGNNTNRYLLVNTYAALPSKECMSAFKMPSDNTDNRILVGIHCYFNADNMDNNFSIVKKYSKKYPLVIGEWRFGNDAPYDKSLVEKFLSYVKEIGIPQIIWDDGGNSGKELYNRKTLESNYPDVSNAIVGK